MGGKWSKSNAMCEKEEDKRGLHKKDASTREKFGETNSVSEELDFQVEKDEMQDSYSVFYEGLQKESLVQRNSTIIDTGNSNSEIEILNSQAEDDPINTDRLIFNCKADSNFMCSPTDSDSASTSKEDKEKSSRENSIKKLHFLESWEKKYVMTLGLNVEENSIEELDTEENNTNHEDSFKSQGNKNLKNKILDGVIIEKTKNLEPYSFSKNDEVNELWESEFDDEIIKIASDVNAKVENTSGLDSEGSECWSLNCVNSCECARNKSLKSKENVEVHGVTNENTSIIDSDSLKSNYEIESYTTDSEETKFIGELVPYCKSENNEELDLGECSSKNSYGCKRSNILECEEDKEFYGKVAVDCYDINSSSSISSFEVGELHMSESEDENKFKVFHQLPVKEKGTWQELDSGDASETKDIIKYEEDEALYEGVIKSENIELISSNSHSDNDKLYTSESKYENIVSRLGVHEKGKNVHKLLDKDNMDLLFVDNENSPASQKYGEELECSNETVVELCKDDTDVDNENSSASQNYGEDQESSTETVELCKDDTDLDNENSSASQNNDEELESSTETIEELYRYYTDVDIENSSASQNNDEELESSTETIVQLYKDDTDVDNENSSASQNYGEDQKLDKAYPDTLFADNENPSTSQNLAEELESNIVTVMSDVSNCNGLVSTKKNNEIDKLYKISIRETIMLPHEGEVVYEELDSKKLHFCKYRDSNKAKRIRKLEYEDKLKLITSSENAKKKSMRKCKSNLKSKIDKVKIDSNKSKRKLMEYDSHSESNDYVVLNVPLKRSKYEGPKKQREMRKLCILETSANGKGTNNSMKDKESLEMSKWEVKENEGSLKYGNSIEELEESNTPDDNCDSLDKIKKKRKEKSETKLHETVKRSKTNLRSQYEDMKINKKKLKNKKVKTHSLNSESNIFTVLEVPHEIDEEKKDNQTEIRKLCDLEAEGNDTDTSSLVVVEESLKNSNSDNNCDSSDKIKKKRNNKSETKLHKTLKRYIKNLKSKYGELKCNKKELKNWLAKLMNTCGSNSESGIPTVLDVPCKIDEQKGNKQPAIRKLCVVETEDYDTDTSSIVVVEESLKNSDPQNCDAAEKRKKRSETELQKVVKKSEANLKSKCDEMKMNENKLKKKKTRGSNSESSNLTVLDVPYKIDEQKRNNQPAIRKLCVLETEDYDTNTSNLVVDEESLKNSDPQNNFDAAEKRKERSETKLQKVAHLKSNCDKIKMNENKLKKKKRIKTYSSDSESNDMIMLKVPHKIHKQKGDELTEISKSCILEAEDNDTDSSSLVVVQESLKNSDPQNNFDAAEKRKERSETELQKVVKKSEANLKSKCDKMKVNENKLKKKKKKKKNTCSSDSESNNMTMLKVPRKNHKQKGDEQTHISKSCILEAEDDDIDLVVVEESLKDHDPQNNHDAAEKRKERSETELQKVVKKSEAKFKSECDEMKMNENKLKKKKKKNKKKTCSSDSESNNMTMLKVPCKIDKLKEQRKESSDTELQKILKKSKTNLKFQPDDIKINKKKLKKKKNKTYGLDSKSNNLTMLEVPPDSDKQRDDEQTEKRKLFLETKDKDTSNAVVEKSLKNSNSNDNCNEIEKKGGLTTYNNLEPKQTFKSNSWRMMMKMMKGNDKSETELLKEFKKSQTKPKSEYGEIKIDESKLRNKLMKLIETYGSNSESSNSSVMEVPLESDKQEGDEQMETRKVCVLKTENVKKMSSPVILEESLKYSDPENFNSLEKIKKKSEKELHKALKRSETNHNSKYGKKKKKKTYGLDCESINLTVEQEDDSDIQKRDDQLKIRKLCNLETEDNDTDMSNVRNIKQRKLLQISETVSRPKWDLVNQSANDTCGNKNLHSNENSDKKSVDSYKITLKHKNKAVKFEETNYQQRHYDSTDKLDAEESDTEVISKYMSNMALKPKKLRKTKKYDSGCDFNNSFGTFVPYKVIKLEPEEETDTINDDFMKRYELLQKDICQKYVPGF